MKQVDEKKYVYYSINMGIYYQTETEPEQLFGCTTVFPVKDKATAVKALKFVEEQLSVWVRKQNEKERNSF